MDFGKAFTFMFEDRNWAEKLGIGMLIFLVPVLNLAVAGYAVEVLRRASRDDLQPLPDWSNLGQYFLDGLNLAIGTFVYTLPVLILFCLALVPFMGPLLTGDTDLQNTLLTAGTLGFFAVACLSVLYGIAFSFLYPAIAIHYAGDSRLGAVFQLGAIFDLIRNRAGTYVMGWLVSLGAGLLVAVIGGGITGFLGFIPFIGWIISMGLSALFSTWGTWVSHFAFGLVSRNTGSLAIE